MKPCRLVSRLAVIPVVLALCAAATADVLIDVESGDKVQGTIDTPETVDSFRIPCPRGATLKVKVKGKKGLRPAAVVVPPLGPAGKGGVALTEGPLPETGVYTVEVSGASGSTGDYTLAASYQLSKRTKSEIDLGEKDQVLELAAFAGTLLKVKVKAKRDSAAVPRIVRVEGPDGFLIDLDGAGKAASDSLGKTELTKDGEYRVHLRDDGDGGAVDVTVQLKQPKPAKRKLDLRGRTIGNVLGERLAVSDVVGTGGGVVEIPLPGEGGPESLISGSNVAVPAGALVEPTPIVISTTTDVQIKGDDGGAGPSVFFGPEGLQFTQDVDVTIPMDVEQFEGDFTTLRVYTRDARGKVSLVPGPYDVDADAGTCTFQVAHFSSFRAARAGAAAAAEAIVGAWRLTDNEPGAGDSFLVINKNGSVDVVSDIPQLGCFRTRILPPGTPLDQAFLIVDGRLRVVGDEEQLEYEPAKPRDVPKNCGDFDPGEL
jgi:hypothetical protein